MRTFCASCQFVDALHDGVLGIENHHVAWSNESARKLLGMNPEGVLLREISSLAGKIPVEKGMADMFRVVTDHVTQLPRRVRFPVEYSWLPGPQGEESGTLIFLDATETMNLKEQLRHSYRDNTGLLSAEGFSHLADQAMRRMANEVLHVIMAIKVTWPCANASRTTIDEVNVDFAKRVALTIRGVDLAGREAEWFYVLLLGVKGEQNIHPVAQRISKAVGTPFFFCGSSMPVDVSIGIACNPKDGGTAQELLAKAREIASSAGTGIHFANPELQQKNSEENIRLGALKKTLRSGSYQIRRDRYVRNCESVFLYAIHVDSYASDEIWQVAKEEMLQGSLATCLAQEAAHHEDDVVVACPADVRNVVTTVFNTEILRKGDKGRRLRFLQEVSNGGYEDYADQAFLWKSIKLADIPLRNSIVLAKHSDMLRLPDALRNALSINCNLFLLTGASN